MPLAIYCAILNQRLDKAILLAVFPPLGFKISLVLWGILEILGVIICLLLFRRLIPAGLPIQVLFTALLLSSFSLLHNLTWGQVGIFTLAAILGMLVLDQAARPLPAAILLALAASFKFYPLIFLIPFAARRDFRFLIYAAAACVALLFLIPGILLGFGDTLRFYGALLDAYRQFDWVVTNYNSQHFPHVLLRLAQAIGYDAMAFLPLLRWIGFGIAAANMGLIFLVQRTRLAYADLWSFQLTFLTIPFVLTTSWPVDLVYLAFAQSFLARWLLEGDRRTLESDGVGRPARENGRNRHRIPARAAVAAIFLLLSIVISNIVFFNLIGNRFLYGGAGFLFWANLSLLVASYVLILPPALRRIRVPRRQS